MLDLHFLQHLFQFLHLLLREVLAEAVVVFREDGFEVLAVGPQLFYGQLMPVFLFDLPCVSLQSLGNADDLLELGVGDLYLKVIQPNL